MNEDFKAILYLFGAGVLLVAGGKLVMAGRKRLPPPSPEEIPFSPRSVALLGDSLTAGPYYRREIKDILGPDSTVKAFGYVGKGTAYIREKLDEALAWHPDDLVVLAGTNDLASGRGVETVISNLSEIYEAAHQQGARVVAVTLVPWGGCAAGADKIEETEEVNDWIWFNSGADAVVDTSSLGDGTGALHPDLARPDNLHLNETGQRALAQEVYLQALGGRNM